ncbi:hypothetical protein DFO73_1181 [Cytobacillus oceanisediminis]|jgi:hypothetical protein|uniref:Uncharacterized protein n=1 Tax=Cytobacillus oceanisediminis TaxID=665099 RepID=A0A2V2ZKC8_9BACI|nr:hypothetical protein [Cytobacillus oceanisediminis]PWW19807.1 hypothetical protein DFO73_1181 [Cytobacillus oceanisediminis]
MKSLQDSLYNWLTIKIVSDERPDDTAAADTEKMFFNILGDEFHVFNIEIEKDEVMYYVHYDNKDGERNKIRFPRELIEVMLNQIKNEPDKYVNYPED